MVRKSKLQLYAPFIALALAQAAFVVWAPSQGEANDPLADLQVATLDPTQQAGLAPGSPGFDPGAPTTAIAADGTPIPTGGPTSSGQPSSAPGAPTSGNEATQGAPGAPGAPAPNQGGAVGDTSHCTAEGRQTDLITTGPECRPRFSGDNGGATYPGVSGDEVFFMRWQCQSNEQVDAILQTQGLAATKAETDAMVEAAIDWIEATYETYGRSIRYEHVVGDCPSAPSDPARSRQAAAEAAKKQPFIVCCTSDPAALDTFAQAGIIAIGGPWNSDAFFSGRRPFRWDIFPDGNESVQWLGEYYCKKLAKGTATHAGRLIHPTIGGRDTPRRVGVISYDNGDGTTIPYTDELVSILEGCTGQKPAVSFYASDINRAQEQTRATVAKLIDEKVTTVICLCDPIAPVFSTQGMTQNNYFPEHLLSGMYLTDYDVLGRLYDQAQWVHAFGPSQLAEPGDFSNSNATRIWRASGRDGEPCAACNLITGYMTLIGSMVHYAGPNLNPLTIEQNMVGAQVEGGGWAASGGNPFDYYIKFGPNDYNAISDFREVFWSPSQRSDIDGKNGRYVSLNGGRRYVGGELDGSFEIPVPPQ